MPAIAYATIIIVAVLAFAAFLIWRAPDALVTFFSNQRHLGAIAATLTAAVPAAVAFVPALAKYQDVLMSLIGAIGVAWGIAIHGTSPDGTSQASAAMPAATPAPVLGTGQPASPATPTIKPFVPATTPAK